MQLFQTVVQVAAAFHQSKGGSCSGSDMIPQEVKPAYPKCCVWFKRTLFQVMPTHARASQELLERRHVGIRNSSWGLKGSSAYHPGMNVSPQSGFLYCSLFQRMCDFANYRKGMKLLMLKCHVLTSGVYLLNTTKWAPKSCVPEWYRNGNEANFPVWVGGSQQQTYMNNTLGMGSLKVKWMDHLGTATS